MTLAELKKLDAGKGEQIPTLQEVIDVIKGKMKLLIDVKVPPPIEEKLVKIIEDSNMEEDTVVTVYSSPHHTEVKRVKELNPRIKTGALFNNPPIDLQLALDLHTDVLHIGDYRYATRDLVERAHKHGLAVFIGTTDDPKELRRLVEIGVDGITTNDPAVLDEIKRQFHSAAFRS